MKVTYVLQANYEGNGWNDAPYELETMEAAKSTANALSSPGFKYRVVKQTREVVK